MYRKRKKQHGLGLVGAIFVIVIVSLLSVSMSKMLEADQVAQSYEILSLKAFLAAESGAQLGVNRLIPPGGGGNCADRTFKFVNDALKFCRADVTCSAEAVGSNTYYALTSTSQCEAGSFVTRRTVQVRIID
jgi:MSHA biogenesis protein MshP